MSEVRTGNIRTRPKSKRTNLAIWNSPMEIDAVSEWPMYFDGHPSKRHCRSSLHFARQESWQIDDNLRKAVRYGQIPTDAPVVLFFTKGSGSGVGPFEGSLVDPDHLLEPPIATMGIGGMAQPIRDLIDEEAGKYLRRNIVLREEPGHLTGLTDYSWHDAFVPKIRVWAKKIKAVRNSAAHAFLEEAKSLGRTAERDGTRDTRDAESIEEKFRRLADEWHRETLYLSSIQQQVMHPAYQKIMAMGKEVLPYILKELEERPDHWFWALQNIVDDGPDMNDVDTTDFEELRDAWLEWGRECGMLQ